MKAEFIGLPDGSIYIVNQPETGADDPLTTLDQIVLMYDAKIKEITPQQPSEGEIKGAFNNYSTQGILTLNQFKVAIKELLNQKGEGEQERHEKIKEIAIEQSPWLEEAKDRRRKKAQANYDKAYNYYDKETYMNGKSTRAVVNALRIAAELPPTTEEKGVEG